MGTNQVQVLEAKGRNDLFVFDPEQLYIEEEEGKPGYDARCKKPLDPHFVANVKALGVHTPIIFQRIDMPDGSIRRLVRAGRNRVRAAREANRQLLQEGGQPIRILARLMKGDEGRMFAITVSENEAREADDPLNRATKVRDLMEKHGYSIEESAVVLSVDVATAKKYIELLDAAPAVREAISAGTLPMSEAVRITRALPVHEQAVVVAEITKNGAVRGKKAREATTRATGKTASFMRGKREAAKVLAVCESQGWKEAGLIVRWLMGEPVARIDSLVTKLEKKKEKG